MPGHLSLRCPQLSQPLPQPVCFSCVQELRALIQRHLILCVPLSLNKLSIQKYLLTHIKSFRHCRVHAHLTLWDSILHYTRVPLTYWAHLLTLPRMSTKPKFFLYHHCYCCSRIQVQKALYILILSLSQVFFIIKLNYISWVLDELLSTLLGWLRPVSCFSSICLHVSNPASYWLLSHRRLSTCLQPSSHLENTVCYDWASIIHSWGMECSQISLLE